MRGEYNLTTFAPGQYVHSDSVLHRADTRAKVVAAALLAVGVLLAQAWLDVAVMASAVTAFYIAANMPFRVLRAQLRPFMWLALAAILLGSGSGGQAIVRLGSWQYTVSDALAGGWTAARMLLIVAATMWLSLTSTPTSLVQGMHVLLQPLAKVGIPIGRLVMTVWIAMRFLPVLANEASRIALAQTARGSDFAGGWAGAWRRISSLAVPMLAAAIHRADAMADALVARGYRMDAMVFNHIGPWHAGDFAIVSAALAPVAVVAML